MPTPKQTKPAPSAGVPIPPPEPLRAARFGRICEELLRRQHPRGEAGIGTLQEKRLHAAIKHFLCGREEYHEVGVDNTRFVSDVRVGNLAFEVQTGAFLPMVKKIEHYLEHTECTVIVVHPIPTVKWISWIDPKTLEIAPRVRSPKKGRPEDLLPELYCLRSYLGHPRLQFHLLFLEVEDFRLLNGRRSRDRKKGSERYERIPLALLGEMELNSPAAFAPFVPPELPPHFTVKQFSDLTRIRGRDAYSAVRVLAALGYVRQGEPIGKSMGWERIDPIFP
ncbi:MAG: hypothetical protein IJX28_06175 [Clostridia bacterium]|nr:hypothetical protein [Clostridia bacterium]